MMTQVVQRSRRVSLRLSILICTVVLVLRTLAHASAPQAIDPSTTRVQRTELLNGLRALSIDRPGETAVINLLIKAGSYADPRDKAGVANLTAQSVCFANAKVPLQRWQDELEFLKAQIEILLTADSTVFQAQAPSPNVEAVLALLARLIVQPLYHQAGVDRIKNELYSSKLNVSEPAIMARLYLGKILFRGTGCARADWGTSESVRPLGIADLEAFHQAHYLPNNAALVVVGGPSMARLGGLVREKFGSWIKGKVPPTEPAVAVIPAKSVIQVIDHKTSSDAMISVAHSTPTRQTPDFFALTLANTLLGGAGEASLLKRVFTEQKVPHQSLSASLELRRACGWFKVEARTPVTAVSAAFAAILESIEDLKTRPISEPELRQAKFALLSNHRAGIESATGLANQVTMVELFDLAPDFLATFPDRVEQISAERVQEAAKNYLSSTQISGVVVGESQTVKASLAEFRSFEISERHELSAKPASGN